MYYTYHTELGAFVLRRQLFTESMWVLTLNDRFVDVYASAAQAADDLHRDRRVFGDVDSLTLPPPELGGWEIRWAQEHDGPAQELWLHRQYLDGTFKAQRTTGSAPPRVHIPSASQGHQRRR